jgi:hypothetical protein
MYLEFGFKASSNVKTVKEQTFHKRSTNVPMSNRNETKTIEFVHEFVPSKEILLFGSVEQKQSVFSKRNSGTITKRLGFVSKTKSERLSFRF